MNEYYKQLVNTTIVDHKIVDDTPILIIQKVQGNEVYFYEIAVKSMDGQQPGILTGLPWSSHG